MSVNEISRFAQCVSANEKKYRFQATLINGVIWIVILGVLALLVIGTITNMKDPNSTESMASLWTAVVSIVVARVVLPDLLAEFNVRMIRATGAGVSKHQYRPVFDAVQQVKKRFGYHRKVQVIVVGNSTMNAFAARFARKKVIVIFSELLEGIIDKPAEIRALIGHEMCHLSLDFGPRSYFELCKPTFYRAARELTCDNAGYVAAGELQAAQTLLKRVYAGNKLFSELNDKHLEAEADYIYSGLLGHFILNRLSHPPVGSRLQSVRQFADRYPSSAKYNEDVDRVAEEMLRERREQEALAT